MKIKELMTDKVRAIGADATVRQAAGEMASIDIGALPVTREGKIVGMITDRDIAVRAVGEGLDPESTPTGKVMTPDVFTVSADEDVTEAARVMRDKQVRRVPVMDKDQRLVGMFSVADLAAKSGDPNLCGEVLKGISEPAAPNL
jgi:CBS domain-containing protein